MAIFDSSEEFFEVELGQPLRIPRKFVQGEIDVEPALLRNLTKQMQKTGKNILPIIVKLLGEDSYKAIQNIHILEAARKAYLDFVWCIVVDEDMLKQVKIESGELVSIPVLSASEEEIHEVLKYAREKKSLTKTFKSQKAARVIVEERNKGTLTSLNFLTKKRCGIGPSTLSKIESFLSLE